jgi:glycosyltransferase involved in cell wall biosynthesis
MEEYNLNDTKKSETDKAIIVVPTFNRFKFFPSLIYQFSYQTYPSDLLEIIILDDSTENVDKTKQYIESLNDTIKHRLTYIYEPNRHIPIGEKRNLLNQYAIQKKAKYIICFDDDDYYPPERVSYAVSALKNSNYQVCGTSILLIYYPKLNEIYKTKSFINKIYSGHAYNGTLAYKLEYAINHFYNPLKTSGEECDFLCGFKTPVLQLDCEKNMLCIAHGKNTIDKNMLIDKYNKTEIKLNEIVKNEHLLNFFATLDFV